MTNCPNCGRPVGGRARACGYCGASLVRDYFQREAPSRAGEADRPVPAGAVASAVLGVCGGLALLAALVCHLLALFGFGSGAPDLDGRWWLRTALMLLPPMIYLGRELALRGWGGSLWGDCLWLFLAATALGFVVLVYLNRGTRAFYGIPALPYLLVLGCSLAAVSSLVGALVRRPDPESR